MELCEYSAARAADEIRAGKITAEAYVESCLERITLRDRDVRAWACIDPGYARQQARRCDREPAKGPLHGIPVGFKDVIDTAELPTEYNSPIYARHRPAWDAASVALTRRAGGIVMGKTATTEFAYRHPGPARNPNNLAHTPGGSSSGSAAAVADFMVPIALGTQTGGSTIRPASYCGIVGYKPSFNLINRAGLKFVAESLDHIGVLARTVEDVALFVHAVSGIDMPVLAELPSRAPRIGFCRQACWSAGTAAMHEKLELAASTLGRKGAIITKFILGNDFDDAYDDHSVIIDFEVARALEYEYQIHRTMLSAAIIEKIENGWRYSRERYDRALANAARYRLLLAERLQDLDFVLTPAAPGEAPEGIESTGSSIFSWIWSLFGVPCVSVPAYQGPQGLPIGVQLVGSYRSDTRLLRWAEWVRHALV